MTDAERELARITAIIGGPEAAGQERFAVHLALRTGFSVEEAFGCMKANGAALPSPAVAAAMAERQTHEVLQ